MSFKPIAFTAAAILIALACIKQSTVASESNDMVEKNFIYHEIDVQLFHHHPELLSLAKRINAVGTASSKGNYADLAAIISNSTSLNPHIQINIELKSGDVAHIKVMDVKNDLFLRANFRTSGGISQYVESFVDKDNQNAIRIISISETGTPVNLKTVNAASLAPQGRQIEWSEDGKTIVKDEMIVNEDKSAEIDK